MYLIAKICGRVSIEDTFWKIKQLESRVSIQVLRKNQGEWSELTHKTIGWEIWASWGVNLKRYTL